MRGNVIRTSWGVALGLALIVTALASTTSALAAPTCATLAAHPRADPHEASTTWASDTWSSVLAAYLRHDPSAASPKLAVLAASPLEAGAWFCTSADTVYLSQALLDYAWLGRASDGADLLAFTLSHELAHRRFDVGDRGFADDTCPPSDSALEALADRRATFLMATASNPATGRGYSPFSLARRDALATFFAAELGWSRGCPALSERLTSVSVALAHIDDLALVWNLAIDLTFAAPTVALEFIDALQPTSAKMAPPSTPWDSLPELELLAAQTHLERASDAGWCPPELAGSGLDPDPCTLRCIPITPRHARLSPRDRDGLRGTHETPVDAAVERAAARTRLVRARALGISTQALAGPTACLAYLERAPDVALAALAQLDQPTGTRLRATLRDTRRLFRLQRFLLEESSPVRSDDWLDAIARFADSEGDDASPAADVLARWLQPITRNPRTPSSSGLTSPFDGFAGLQSTCSASTRLVIEGSARIAIRGACSDIALAARHLEVLVPPLPTSARALAAWRDSCQLSSAGATDDGLTVLRARCDSWDDEATWVLYMQDHVVLRAVRVQAKP